MTELFQPVVDTGAPAPEPPTEPLGYRLAKAAFFSTTLFLATVVGANVARPDLGGTLPFAIVLYGIARVVIDSTITKPIRVALGAIPILGPALYETDTTGRGIAGLFTCYVCVGTWTGLGLAVLGLRVVHDASAVGLLLNAAAGAALAQACHAAVSTLEAQYHEG